jgi:hypothetical protein
MQGTLLNKLELVSFEKLLIAIVVNIILISAFTIRIINRDNSRLCG